MKVVPLQRFAAVALLLSMTLILIGQTDAPVQPATKPVDPPIGTYHWACGMLGADAFANWLDRDGVWVLDTIGSETWDNISYPTWWLSNWSKWVHAKPGRRLILSVPILAGPPDRSGPRGGSKGVGVAVSLEKGAAGDYDAHFRDLAANLVRYDMTDTIVRPAWEFNGDWYAWGAKGRTDAFIAFWRRIVNVMRSVSGAEHLLFCWNPTLGQQQFPADEAWPGDEYVDYVGVDVYDETWMPDTYPFPPGADEAEIARRRDNAWNNWIMNSPRGLAFWSDFAKAHHKPLAFPEWGLVWANHNHGGLDNPLFIQRMHDFITDPDNHVAFHCYFDVNLPDHGHELSPGLPGASPDESTHFPKSAALFRKLFRKQN
ncbi:MAG: hypothetical protein GC162_20955 [Planctomycetes bacterium]|nr:hypothetical protein [Planctomycetota bacterium]